MEQMVNDDFSRGIEIVGSAIIENSHGQILLTKSPKWNNKWIFPGGHIEPGESIKEAITREAEEETSLKLNFVSVFTSGELIGSTDFHRPAHFIYFDAHCKLINGSVKLDLQELTEYRWVTPKDAFKLDLAENYPEVIQKFIDYLDQGT